MHTKNSLQRNSVNISDNIHGNCINFFFNKYKLSTSNIMTKKGNGKNASVSSTGMFLTKIALIFCRFHFS